MLTRLSKSLSVLLLLCILTGCWDRLEIEERAIILGIGIDYVNGDPKDLDGVTTIKKSSADEVSKLIRITAQIAVPGRIPLGAGGEGGGQNDEEPVWAVSAYGKTIDGAFATLQQELADKIFYGHLRVIVVSEEFARSGISNLNDYFKRNPQIRRLTWVTVSSGEAADIMNAQPELERVPTLYLLAMLDHAVKLGKYPNEYAGRFWVKESSDGQDGHLPYIKLREQNKIKVQGMAIFHGDKMVDVTEPIEIGFYMALSNTKQGGYSAYITLPDNNDTALFQATDRRSLTEVRIVNGKPKVRIDVNIDGNLVEVTQDVDHPSDPHIIQSIEKRLAKDAQDAMLKLVAKTQALESDILGIGEIVRAKYNSYWRQHVKSKDQWHAIYRDLDIDVNVVLKVRRIGMKEI